MPPETNSMSTGNRLVLIFTWCWYSMVSVHLVLLIVTSKVFSRVTLASGASCIKKRPRWYVWLSSNYCSITGSLLYDWRESAPCGWQASHQLFPTRETRQSHHWFLTVSPFSPSHISRPNIYSLSSPSNHRLVKPLIASYLRAKFRVDWCMPITLFLLLVVKSAWVRFVRACFVLIQNWEDSLPI